MAYCKDHHVWSSGYQDLLSMETEPQQDFITPADRALLVDYLIWLGDQHHYREQVPYLAISLVDRYLSLKTMTGVEELGLLGIAAFCLATEHYEDDPLDCTDLAGSINWSMPFGYRNFMQEVSEMKSDLVNAFGFSVGAPTIMSFLPGFVEASATTCGYDHDDHQLLWLLAKNLANLALRDYNCCDRFLPSVIAASAVFLAVYTIEPEGDQLRWTDEDLERITSYRLSDLEDCILMLDRLQQPDQEQEEDEPSGTLVLMIMFRKISEMIRRWFKYCGMKM